MSGTGDPLNPPPSTPWPCWAPPGHPSRSAGTPYPAGGHPGDPESLPCVTCVPQSPWTPLVPHGHPKIPVSVHPSVPPTPQLPTGSATATPCPLCGGRGPPCRCQGPWWTARGPQSPRTPQSRVPTSLRALPGSPTSPWVGAVPSGRGWAIRRPHGRCPIPGRGAAGAAGTRRGEPGGGARVRLPPIPGTRPAPGGTQGGRGHPRTPAASARCGSRGPPHLSLWDPGWARRCRGDGDTPPPPELWAFSPSTPSLPPLGGSHLQPTPKTPAWAPGGTRVAQGAGDDPCLSFPELGAGGALAGGVPGLPGRGDPGQWRGQWVFVCRGHGDPPAAGSWHNGGFIGAGGSGTPHTPPTLTLPLPGHGVVGAEGGETEARGGEGVSGMGCSGGP